MAKKKSASQDGFEIAEGLSGIRNAPGMYLGEQGSDMAYRVVKEEVDNAYDEAVAGRNNLIEVVIDEDEDFHIVADGAGGIPTEKKKLKDGSKVTILTAAFTRVHAGGKFNDKAYKTSCFTGDTKIRMLDGTVRTMEWLAENYYDRAFWVYSCTPEGYIVPGKAFFPRMTKSVDVLYEITLDNGQKERCTDDHRWMLRDGTYCKARDLEPGVSLMPLYTKEDDQNHTLVRLNNMGQPHLRREGKRQRNRKYMYAPMYRMVYAHMSDSDRLPGYDIHHADFNPRNDCPENLVRIKKKLHKRLHSVQGQRTGALSSSLVKYNQSEKGRATSSRIGKENVRYLKAFSRSAAGRKASSEKMRNLNKLNSIEQQRGRVFKVYLYITRYLELPFNRDTYAEYKIKTTRSWERLSELFANKKDIENNVEDYLKRKRRSGVGYDSLMQDYHAKFQRQVSKHGKTNHKVVSVKEVYVKQTPVYDLSVETYHNFALDSGVFVHNSGTHGVGVAAANAVSSSMRVFSTYNGSLVRQEFACGEIVGKPDPVRIKKLDTDIAERLSLKASKYGTIVATKLDQTVVSADAKRGKKLPKKYEHASVPVRRTADWLSDMAMLNPGLRILLTVISKGKTKTTEYLNKKTLEVIPKVLAEKSEVSLVGKPFVFETDYISCTIAWSDHTDSNLLKTFVNTSPTIDGGWHKVGLQNALSVALKPYMPKTKKKSSVTPSDLVLGAVGMFNWKMHGAQYTSQVKDKLASRVDKEVSDLITEPLIEYFDKNKRVAKHIIKFVTAMNKGREELAATVKSMAEVRKKTRGNMLPASLAEAPRAKAADRELFLVEGDSAAGCFTDDTPVLMHDGTIKTFGSLLLDYYDDIDNYGISYDVNTKTFFKQKFIQPRLTKAVNQLSIVTFHDGSEYKCTTDHKWLCLDEDSPSGYTFVEAINLTTNHLVCKFYTYDDYADHATIKGVRTEYYEEPVSVYDATMPKSHTFVLANGCVVHNTAINSRNSEYQEVLPATGKPLNALTNSLAKVISHRDVGPFLIALGADLKTLDLKKDNPTIDVSKLRVGHVILLVDSDPDGGHIAVLYLAVIYRLMPDLFKQGRVWCIDSPLFAALHKGELYGGMTFKEARDAAPKAVKDKEIVRIKGWGEVDENYLEPIAFDPDTRKLIQINPFASAEDRQEFLNIVGEGPEFRRQLLGLLD